VLQGGLHVSGFAVLEPGLAGRAVRVGDPWVRKNEGVSLAGDGPLPQRYGMTQVPDWCEA
jgi:hypothetical protein